MLKLISILPTAKQRQLRHYLHQQRSLLTLDTSSYGVGRQRYWLQHEPILGSCGRRYRPASQQPQFWRLCQTIYKNANRIALPEQASDVKPDVGLVAYGDVGIRQHRDDPYAACPAVSINLSTAPTRWGYTAIYGGYDKQGAKRASEKVYQLPPGGVIMFNSQNPHRVISPDPERWSINLWRIASTCRPYFQHYLDAHPRADNNTVSFSPQVGEQIHGQKRADRRANWGPTVGVP